MAVILLGALPVVAWAFGWSAALGAALLIGLGAPWATVVLVLLLRWRNPPASAFMLRVAWARRRAGQVPHVEHTWVPEVNLPPELRLAAIAGEDAYFALHAGFDWESLRAAHAYNQARGAGRRGGSTISQQVAKNLFLWQERSYLRKAIEIYFTLLIEAAWPKRRILEVYLNVAQFGPYTFGAEAAARRFFNKPALALTRSEAALLVAVLPNPNNRRADQPERTLRYRQLLILGSMQKLGPNYLARLDAASRGTSA